MRTQRTIQFYCASANGEKCSTCEAGEAKRFTCSICVTYDELLNKPFTTSPFYIYNEVTIQEPVLLYCRLYTPTASGSVKALWMPLDGAWSSSSFIKIFRNPELLISEIFFSYSRLVTRIPYSSLTHTNALISI